MMFLSMKISKKVKFNICFSLTITYLGKKWLKIAAEQGHMLAIEELKKLEENSIDHLRSIGYFKSKPIWTNPLNKEYHYQNVKVRRLNFKSMIKINLIFRMLAKKGLKPLKNI